MRNNDEAKFDYWDGRKTLEYFRLMTWIYKLQRFLETVSLEVLMNEAVDFD